MVLKFEVIADIVQYLSVGTVGGRGMGTSEVVGLTGSVVHSEAWAGLWIRAL